MAISDRTLAAALSLFLAGCATGRAATAGEGAPALTAPDGARVSVDGLCAQHEATVLVFWSAGCPCVRRYQARLDALLGRYPERRVLLAAVVSNAGESLDEARQVATRRGVKVPLYADPSGALAQWVGAKSTPTAVVLDRDGRVRFKGWIDNEREPGTPGRQPWLENAIDGVLDGRGFTARTPTWGCTITRSLFAAESGGCAAPNP